MADTRSDIRDDLRERIGELTAGTWTDAELNRYIHLAERKVGEDCILNGQGLLTTEWETPLLRNVYQYALPQDFVDVLVLQHYHDGTYYNLESNPIAGLLSNFNPTSRTGSYHTHYSIHGTVARVLDEGVLTNAAGSNTLAQNANTNWLLMNLRADLDRIVNLTDGSQAVITVIAAQQLTTDGLEGGTTNLFRNGDRFQIESGEQYLRQLWVYPPLSADEDEQELAAYETGNDDTINIGDVAGVEFEAAQSFQSDVPFIISSVEVNLGAETGTPLGPVIVELQTNNAGVPSNTLVHTGLAAESIASIDSPSENGWNKATLEDEMRFAADTTYWIVAKCRAQDNDTAFTWVVDTTAPTYTDGQVATRQAGGAWAAVAGSDALFRINGYTADESLQLHYARYPREMAADTDLTEIPRYAYEAMMYWAEYLAFRKRYGARGRETQEARFAYCNPNDPYMRTGELGRVRKRMIEQVRGRFGTVRNVTTIDSRKGWHHGLPPYIPHPLS